MILCEYSNRLFLIPQTSVALGVLAALLEEKNLCPGPKPVRGNWPAGASGGLQGYSRWLPRLPVAFQSFKYD